jgi:hypothetical protein
MKMLRARKRRVLDAALAEFRSTFTIVGTGEHARRAVEQLTRGALASATNEVRPNEASA